MHPMYPNALGTLTALMLVIGPFGGCDRLSSRRWDGTTIQTSANGCAPAALQMILKSYGLPLPLDSVERAFRMTTKGASISEVLRVARSFGLRASAWRVPEESLSVSTLPAMLFLDDDHFAVLDSVKESVCSIRDPAAGRYHLGPTELRNRWNGIILLFSND